MGSKLMAHRMRQEKLQRLHLFMTTQLTQSKRTKRERLDLVHLRQNFTRMQSTENVLRLLPPLGSERERIVPFDFTYLTQDDFLKKYRFSKTTFGYLHAKIFDVLVSEKSCSTSANGKFPLNLSIANSLRILAGDSSSDIISECDLLPEDIYIHLWTFIEAFLATRLGTVEFYYEDDNWLSEQTIAFRQVSVLGGRCAGILDGAEVRIKNPGIVENLHPDFYRSRKGFHALNVQAICSYDLRFSHISVLCPASVHDSYAFSSTFLSNVIYAGLQNDFFIASDDAYPFCGSIMTKYLEGLDDPFKKSFNFFLDLMRCRIDSAFSLLFGKWGILQNPLEFPVPSCPRLMIALARLHNTGIDLDSEISCSISEHYEELGRSLLLSQDHYSESYNHVKSWQDEVPLPKTGEQEASRRRENMYTYLKQNGIVTPDELLRREQKMSTAISEQML